MAGRIRYALRIAAIVHLLGIPSLAYAAPKADANAVQVTAIAAWLSTFGLSVIGEHPQIQFNWPMNIAALRYRGLARTVREGVYS